MTREEEKKLAQAMEKAGASEEKIRLRNRFVEEFMGLVVSMAKKYKDIHRIETPIDDLIQYGIFGLIKGAEKFNWRKGCRFSTHAYWWIKQEMALNVINNEFFIGLPYYVAMNEEFFEKNNYKIIKDPLVFHFIPDENSFSAFEEIEERDYSQKFWEVVENNLKDEREKFIIRERYKNTDKKTLKEIGGDLNITEERVRQIENKALSRLRRKSCFFKNQIKRLK